MKHDVLKRLESAERKMLNMPGINVQRIVEKMTTEELVECLDENTPDDRLEEIWKAAMKR